MLPQLHQTALVAFALLMAAAAFEDFRRFIIPNALTLGLCVLWPVYASVAMHLPDALQAIGCALIVFLVGALLFSRGYVGGGDVKLLSAATLWAGPGATPTLLAATGLLGGVLALLLLTHSGAQAVAAGRALLTPPDAPAMPTRAVPYGVAIAAAALIVIIPRNFS